jgi:ABC-2 type transport system ATP-binding protein
LDLLHVDIQKSGYTDKNVIRDIHFTIQPGEIVGLIGPNGAGKSTTIKTIIGLLGDFTGSIQFGGKNGFYTYVPEHPILYDGLTLYEHLEIAASSYGLTSEQFARVSTKLLQQFQLLEAKDDLPTSFSKGMQQKMMLTLGFLVESDVYIIDEPFIGLDPRAVKDFVNMLEEQKRRGAGVLMCTHVLDTAEKICDRFVMLNRGEIVAQGDLHRIRETCQTPDASLFDCFLNLTDT